MKKYFILNIIILLSFVVNAQVLTTTNKKAIKNFENGMLCFRNKTPECAIESLEKAIEADPNFVEAYYLLGNVYYSDVFDYKQALKYFKKGAEINPNIQSLNLKKLAELEMMDMQYTEAEDHLNLYLKINQARLRREEISEAYILINNCAFAQTAVQNPVPFNPVNMGENINTPLFEVYPTMTVDRKYFLYTRTDRNPDLVSRQNPEGLQEDFYISVGDGENSWSQSFNIGAPINTPTNNEGAATIGADGQTIILTICETFNGYPEGKKGFGSCDLFYSSLEDGKFSFPRNLGPNINTGAWETHPSFSSDGKTLYFIRGASIRSQNHDIYVSKLNEEGYWEKPTRLPDNINTPYSEQCVFIHPDGKTLYFSSNGHQGMGGYDFFVTRMQEDGSWSDPENLGYPINTSSDEFSLMVDPNGKLAYISSDREGGFGSEDIYYFELPEKVKPNPVTYLAGKVYNDKTKDPIGAYFELIDLSTNQVVIESYSNQFSGEYLVTLPKDRDYALICNRKGFLPFSESFLFSLNKGDEVFRKDVPLQPIEVGETFVLKNIFFETAKYNLKQKSEAELNKLIDFLSYNNTLKVEIGGHTDNVGSETDNQVLSENRANEVLNYLVEHGIDKERLTAVGYGETKPIDINETDTGRANNRRTEFKVLSK